MVKAIVVVILVVSFICGMYAWGTYPREAKTYENMQPTTTHRVLCITDSGDATTYHIMMPSFEGFSDEVVYDLKKSYEQGFCNSVNRL